MDKEQIIESLSPNERKILPLIENSNFKTLVASSNLDKVAVLRTLEFLKSKSLIELKIEKKKIVDLGTNGIHYQKTGLPERQLLPILENKIISINNAEKSSNLSPNEFKAALGALKNKAVIELKNGNIHLTEKKENLSKKSLEEQLLESLPIEHNKLAPEQLHALNSLKKRKDIIIIKEEQVINYNLTEKGKELLKQNIESSEKFIEQLDAKTIASGSWKGKKFRRYDIESKVPEISGGKKHFVNQSLEYTRRIWTELGFKEMQGNIIQPSFWVFDALFTAQDHSVREMQDTFFINAKQEILDKKIVKTIKQTHETGIGTSKGWQYQWNEEKAKQLVLRTHTTVLSAQTLYNLSQLPKEQRHGKFFALGKNFRNETVDWSHGFEFYQTEGIVIDKNANFKHLLGYLKEFYKKMGFEKVRFRPAYFPYTEPSVEIDIYHPEKKCWIELGGAGIFRPEITIPLLGEKTPVLAWGQGFDRIIMDYYKIKDLRELYKNNIKQLRNMKIWNK